MAVAFDFLRFWLNAPSWAAIFESLEAHLAMGGTTSLPPDALTPALLATWSAPSTNWTGQTR